MDLIDLREKRVQYHLDILCEFIFSGIHLIAGNSIWRGFLQEPLCWENLHPTKHETKENGSHQKVWALE